MGNININNVDQRKIYQDKYFTPEGIKALETRLQRIKELYEAGVNYPAKFKMLGFPALFIKNEERHLGIMEDLVEILGIGTIQEEKDGN